MKIAAIYTQSVGPLGDAEISFKNDWTGKVEESVLLTGLNGCGKSTLLRGIAMLWDALGFWLDREKPLPVTHNAKKWLQQWGTFAIVVKDLKCSHYSPDTFGFIFGDKLFAEKLIKKHPTANWIGEISLDKKRSEVVFEQGSLTEHLFDDYIKMLRVTRAQVVLGMLTSGMDLAIPNVIYLDAEERRWIAPTRNISDLVQDDLNQRWLATYTPTSDWKGQLEASLFNMKATLPNLYPEMLKNLNQFFSGKFIEENIQPGQRQQVRLANGDTHTLDELSSGEHQVLIMLFMVQRWLQPGGVVLIDEPDLHLHPSLVSPLLATLENIIQGRSGQLIITSHATDLWQRYDNLGLRINLNDRKGADNGQH
ncbi:AAA family ATPase [Yersinia enterocolitica]|uniref:AAA family ATPase n=1 Tax=Yersinia enterocolitica TaxID=630 RepID=UPI003B8581D4